MAHTRQKILLVDRIAPVDHPIGSRWRTESTRDAADYGSIRMITEALNSGFAAREQMGSDTCSASRTTGTYFQPKPW
jgi:hypothetical protein